MVGNAAVYDSTNETLTIDVQAFSITRLFVTGNGYLKSVVLYIDQDSTSGYSSGDTVLGQGVVQEDLTEISPSTIVFSDISAADYSKLQNYIVDAYVTYSMEIIDGYYNHTHSEADFTLHSSFLTYPSSSANISKSHAS